MIWVRRILKVCGVLLLLIVIGLVTTILLWGRPPAKRPDLVTPIPAGVPEPPRGYPSQISAFLAAYAFYDLIVIEDAPGVDGVDERYDIVYGKGGDTELSLDLFLPTGIDKPAPGVVLFYGGGWKSGRKDQLREYAQHFARNGYVVALPQYRLRDTGVWPNSVHDAKTAMRWMRAHAEENFVDPDRIGVMGNSAGAYLALMVGYTPGVEEFEGDGGWEEFSSDAQVVVDIYGPTDFTEPERRNHDLIVSYMSGVYEDDPSRYERASPIRYVNADTPPTCVIHGTVDMLVPVHQSDWLVEKLQEHGVPHYYSRIDGWPHAMDGVRAVNLHTRELILAFLDEYLRDAETEEAPTETTQASAASTEVSLLSKAS